MDAIRTPNARLSAPRVALLCGLAAFAASAWLSASADTEVYKWVDPQGRIHYSDRPPPTDGKLLSMESTPSARARAAAERPAPSPQPAAPAASRSTPPAAGTPSALKAAVDNDVATVRVEQCKAAQDRYQNYIRSRHLYREGPDKERIYLSDAEQETERLNAKREADEACAGN
jgi:hypothetical protein